MKHRGFESHCPLQIMRKDDLYFKVLDDYYDHCADIFRPDLNSPDPEKRKLAKHMVEAMEHAKTIEYTAVKDPFIKGHTVVVQHKRGEPRPLIWEEERYNALPWYEKFWGKVRKFLSF
jgi:hypothetical protein